MPPKDQRTRDEDWLRTYTWDLPTNVDVLERWFSLEALVQLPAWEAAPAMVKREVNRRLGRRTG